ncbi:MAG: phosphopantetheine-binding protein [Planctomycetes bacterium]|nr:phosphopantetheine-binding protein [Planctomycetota bacterium]
MDKIGFFLLLAVIAMTSYSITELLSIRRRRLRNQLLRERGRTADEIFTAGVSGILPVPQSFVRAFRLAVGRALSVDGLKLQPTDRIARDLKAVNFEGMELAMVLERAFDIRVTFSQLVRAKTLRELCKYLYERTEDISEFDPPLHRDPAPKVREPDEEEILDVDVESVS